MWKTFYRKDSERVSVEYTEVLHAEQTDILYLEILQTRTLGEMILMDGCPEICAVDVSTYHEAMVHPACIIHGGVRDVFVAGGGEGVMLRELLRHSDVDRIVQCDIDRRAILAFEEHLPHWHQGSFSDPRVELRFGDARAELDRCDETYDLVLVDVTAPTAGGPSNRLFTREFYELVRSRLKPAGVVVAQAQSVNPNNLECFATLHRTISAVFETVEPMHYPFVSTGDDWGLLFATHGHGHDPTALGVAEVERRIAQRGLALSFYSGRCHQSLFNLPKYVYDRLAAPCPLSTDAAPFVYPLLPEA